MLWKKTFKIITVFKNNEHVVTIKVILIKKKKTKFTSIWKNKVIIDLPKNNYTKIIKVISNFYGV